MDALIILLSIIFLFFSSKSLGSFTRTFLKIKTEDKNDIVVGFFVNSALYFICIFFVMFLKLSSDYLLFFGFIYFFICIFSIIFSFKRKELFSFEKNDLISLLLTIVLVVLYGYFIDFSRIETYDSYFYSVLSNGAANTKQISFIDPYSGVLEMQNYYKYLSFYLLPSFFSIITGVKAYLFLIWSMAFMNLFVFVRTALGPVRISKSKMINNFLSLFYLTFILSLFRAPFNALFLTLYIVPIYLFDFFLKYENVDKKYYYLFIVVFFAMIGYSSSALFLMICTLYLLFIYLSFKKDHENLKRLFIPISIFTFLIFLFLFESLKLSAFLLLLFLLIIYILLKNKPLRGTLMVAGKFAFVVVPISFMIVASNDKLVKDFSKTLLNKGSSSTFETDIYEDIDFDVEDKNILDFSKTLLNKGSSSTFETDIYEDIDFDVEDKNILDFSDNWHSSSMAYIYNGSIDNAYSRVIVGITHSIFKYGGLLFLLLSIIYSFVIKKFNTRYVVFISFLITFFNPLSLKFFKLLTFGLEDRIIYFFMTPFALIGIKKFFESLQKGVLNKFKLDIQNLYKYGNIILGILIVISVYLFLSSFKEVDWYKHDFLYKIPIEMKEAEKKLNDYIKKEKVGKEMILYTASTFNISMIDEKPNEKVKFINSKEYMSHFSTGEINNKIILSSFFDNYDNYMNIYLDKSIENKTCKPNDYDKTDCLYKVSTDNVISILKKYNIKFVVYKTNDNLKKFIIENDIDIIYEGSEITIILIN